MNLPLTRLRHADFWDAGFYAGSTPHEPVYVAERPCLDFEASLVRLGRAVETLAGEFEVLGFDAVLGLPWRARPASEPEKDSVRATWPGLIRGMSGWPVHKPGLDTSALAEGTLARVDTLEVLELTAS